MVGRGPTYFQVYCPLKLRVQEVVIDILLHSRNHVLGERSLPLADYDVLSKVASAVLILPISKTIRQLRWTSFRGNESKESIEFVIFGKASQGDGAILSFSFVQRVAPWRLLV
jgi:hypothetical protein